LASIAGYVSRESRAGDGSFGPVQRGAPTEVLTAP